MKKKTALILTNLLILGSICLGLYVLVKNSEQKHKVKLENVNKGFKYSKGIIIDIKSYKGHSLTIKYKIEKENYRFKGGWDFNPKKLAEGDSISFRFSIENPNYIITELEKEY